MRACGFVSEIEIERVRETEIVERERGKRKGVLGEGFE